jgi:uncharacterized phage protein gp47/JayE
MSNYTGRTTLTLQKAAYRQEAENNFGINFDTTTSSNNYKLMYPILSELVTRYSKLENWLDQRNVYNAEGAYLDQLLGNFNFIRKQASSSTVEWSTSDSTSGTVVAVGDLQVQDDDSNIFENITGGTVASDGTLTLTMQSVETGEDQNINAGTLNTVVTPVSGIANGTNSDDAEGGQDKETDSEFRIRFLTSGASGDAWTLAALQTALLELDGVTSAAVFENEDLTDNSLGMPGKSIYCVVNGGTDADIAQAIYDNTNHAIYRYGTEVVTVTDERGEDVVIRFDRPTEVTLEYTLTITPSQTVTTIEAEIEDYINGTEINDTISAYKCIKQIEANQDTDSIETMEITFRRAEDAGEYYSTLKMDETEKAVI